MGLRRHELILIASVVWTCGVTGGALGLAYGLLTYKHPER